MSTDNAKDNKNDKQDWKNPLPDLEGQVMQKFCSIKSMQLIYAVLKQVHKVSW